MMINFDWNIFLFPEVEQLENLLISNPIQLNQFYQKVTKLDKHPNSNPITHEHDLVKVSFMKFDFDIRKHFKLKLVCGLLSTKFPNLNLLVCLF